jgi:alpha-glucosidase (family GH31 glycosyl hydrolase)
MFGHFRHLWQWRKLFAPLPLFFSLAGGYAMAAENAPVVVAGKARFTVITAACVRLEYSENGQFVDEPSLFAHDRTEHYPFTCCVEDGKHVIATPYFKLYYKANARPFSADNLEVFIARGKETVRWLPGLKNRHNLGGTLRTVDQVRGKVPLPDGVLARDGWFLLDDSRRPLVKDGWVVRRPETSGSDWYLFAYGHDFKAALASLTAIGGRVPLPRKYAMGSWYSRYWPYSSEEFRQIVAEYHAHDFPLDIMVLDMDWHKDGWTGWSWNRELLPDAEKLLASLHQEGLAVTLNVHPADGVGPHEDMYRAFMQDMNAEVKNEAENPVPRLPFDAADKKYLDTLFKHTHVPLEKQGVDFWWLDWQQYEFTLGNPELRNLEWLNRYYFEHTARDDRRGISFSRWGGWGDHRHPIHFSGDAVSIWPMLEFEIPFTATAGNVGCFFWSHDIGGHFGGLTPETNARWVQFGALSAALRLHSTRDKNMDKRPWLSDAKFAQCMRIAFRLRTELFPYIYASAARSCRESLPLTQPMYIEYPQVEIAYHVPQQYFFGDALLAAPIVTPGSGKEFLSCQRVWFPPGVWYNWFTGERYTGGSDMHNVWADIYEIPLYAKGGVPIPLQPYTERMATAPLKHLVVRTYAGPEGGEGSFTLYEDDGVSQEYTRGRFAATLLHYRRTGNKHEVRMDGTTGTFQGQLPTRAYTFEFPGTQLATSALVNGIETACEYDAARAVNRVHVSEMPIGQPIIVHLTAVEADFAKIERLARERRIAGLLGKKPKGRSVAASIAVCQREAATPLDAYHATSLLSGLAIYAQDSRTIHVLKETTSPVRLPCNIQVVDTIGSEERTVWQERCAIEAGKSRMLELASELPACFGVRNTREVRVTFSVQEEDFSLRQVVAERDSGISHWQLVGPFVFDSKRDIAEQPHAPELAEKIAISAVYTGSEGQVHWQMVEADADDIVDIRTRLDFDFRIAYAVAYIKASEEQEVEFLVNSDDGVEVWLNHKKIHSHHVFRAISHEPDRAKAKLNKGINTLLVKISQGEGGWCFKVRVKSQSPLTTAATPEEL